MKECKFCKGQSLIKNGVVRCKQRYCCKLCGKNQVSGDRRVKYTGSLRHLALAMCLNSCGFRVIGRVLNVPFQLVHSWIKKAGALVEEMAPNPRDTRPKNIEILEMDELYVY